MEFEPINFFGGLILGVVLAFLFKLKALKALGLDVKTRLAQIREGKFWDKPEGWEWLYSKLLDRYLEYGKISKKPRTSRLAAVE